MKNVFIIPEESKIKSVINTVRSDENSIATREILNRLFALYPDNNNIINVYQKVVTLNQLYSTSIFSTFKIAKYIASTDLDKLLHDKNLKAVDRISQGHGILNLNKKEYTFYSFATKYCSYHCPNVYPIYDKYVEAALWNFMRLGYLHKYKSSEIKNYTFFNELIKQFIQKFNLQSFSLKDIDDFLWYIGKDIYRNNKN